MNYRHSSDVFYLKDLATILKFSSRVRTPSFLISVEIPAQLTVLQKAQLYVDQLRREASKQRIPVSDAISDIKVNTKMNLFFEILAKIFRNL